MRILLVEDNDADAALVREMLHDSDPGAHEVVHVRRLAEALARLGAQSFDAVLLDLGLPDAGGLDALRPIHQAVPDVPVVVLSGYQDELRAVEAVKHGAQDFLMKGLNNGLLLGRSLRYAVERKRTEQQIQHCAQHDGLTDLPNRRLLLDRLKQALARARRERGSVAVMFVDLDDFKRVNDSCGHDAGDRVLQETAARLLACVRASDTVARLGGDEFTLVVPGIGRVEDVTRLASKVLAALRRPITIDGRPHIVTASMGISVFPGDGDTPEELLRRADATMYRAKQQGRDGFQFNPSGAGAAGSPRRRSLATALERAIERDQLVLHYQPRVGASDYRIVGLEALVRWQHPRQGLIPPSRFVPTAEDSGVIVPLGRWVLREACRQTQEWNAAGLEPPLAVSVNVSVPELIHPGWRAGVEAALAHTGLPPSMLELEVTEGRFVDGAEEAFGVLRELRGIGVRIAIDDFGTGHSSLNRLKRLPVDTLKVDRSFVRDVAREAGDEAIVAAIVTMGRGLGLRVVTEGVETADQASRLAQLGCDEMQGYLFGRPQPSDTAAAWFRGRARTGTDG